MRNTLKDAFKEAALGTLIIGGGLIALLAVSFGWILIAFKLIAPFFGMDVNSFAFAITVFIPLIVIITFLGVFWAYVMEEIF